MDALVPDDLWAVAELVSLDEVESEEADADRDSDAEGDDDLTIGDGADDAADDTLEAGHPIRARNPTTD